MALCGEHAHVCDILEGLAGLRDQPEHADGAGQGGCIGEDLVAAVADPVSAGCGEFAVGCDHGNLQKVEFVLDLLGSEHAATRGVHAEHQGLDAFVGADLVDFLGETVPRDAGELLAVDDFTIGVEHRDLVFCTEVGEDLGIGIIGEGDEFDIGEIALHRKCGQALLEGVAAEYAIHKAGGQIILGQAEFDVLHQGIQFFERDAAALGDGLANGLPHRIDHTVVLLLILFAGAVAHIHLASGFILSMADELHIEPGLVEQVLEVEGLRAKAHQAAVCTLILRHIDLVGNGIQIETAGAGILGPGDDGLAAETELFQRFAQLSRGRYACAAGIGLEVDELHSGVGGRSLYGLHGFEDAQGNLILPLNHCHGVCRHFLLGNGHFRKIDGEHSRAGQRGAALAGGGLGSRTDYAGDDHKHKNVRNQDAANHGKKRFEELFHLFGNYFRKYSIFRFIIFYLCAYDNL